VLSPLSKARSITSVGNAVTQGLPSSTSNSLPGRAIETADTVLGTTASGVGLTGYGAELTGAALRGIPLAANTVATTKGIAGAAGRVAVPLALAGHAIDTARLINDPRGVTDAAAANIQDYGDSFGSAMKAVGHNTLQAVGSSIPTIAATVRGVGELGSQLVENRRLAARDRQLAPRYRILQLQQQQRQRLKQLQPPQQAGTFVQKTSMFSGLVKIAQQNFAPGIVDKAVYGDVLGTLKPGDITDFVLQHHSTVRNPKYPHYDMRLGTKDTNLFSWAIPKAELPRPGTSKMPIPQTQLHTYQYGSFEGKIPHGYGAGVVRMADKGKAVITRVTPNTLHFTLGHTKVPTRYVLVHIGGRDGKMWQLIAKPEPGKVPGADEEPIYARINAVDQDDAIQQATQVQAKIDKAASLIPLRFINKKGGVKASAAVEIADTAELRRIGLSKRASLPANHGMFFDKVGAFWMKDVHFPLDLVFVDRHGTVLEKHAMPVDKGGRKLYRPSSADVAHAIELPHGWCDRYGITTGDIVKAG
jgi:uncharacterized membrane protein (UPF0127 family)